MISQILFAIALGVAIYFFGRAISKIRRNILLGKDLIFTGTPKDRMVTMLKVAFGQTKMSARPIPAVLHFIVYAGFLIINIEVLEIIIDGLFGTHRVFAFLGPVYNFLIGSFEILAFLVFVACVIFLIRRNTLKIKRFFGREMTAWPKSDANYILIIELLLMGAFLKMNAADYLLQGMGADHYVKAGSYPISSWLVAPLMSGLSEGALIMIERGAWWFHILGILAFLNYLPYSKHFHIVMAFPNTYFSNLKSKGALTNMASVKKEVELMMDPNADPYAVPAPDANAEPQRFGAKDVQDLNWKQLMNAYTCTECGRCTDECPANKTGKLLSPRSIMMDTRDRLEEVGKNIDANKGVFVDDGKGLVHDYISKEELWACTTCNACTEACPINIDPLSIIIDLRRYLVLEESAAPQELNMMSTNIENNGAPWQFSQSDRLKWATED